ncbi:hypothetical protein KA977_10130, partial [Candidatus Dependentiae bacterium]|nr:hypothetical protein [Candidatus Dependentiae bacterium]
MKKLFFLVVLTCLIFSTASIYAATKEWTWMVYMDGDCNLEGDAVNDFNEMATSGSNENLNIVVQFDRIPGENSSYGNWTDTRRFYIKKGDTPQSTPVQNLGEKNMGDPNTLKDFIVWTTQNYPAKKYALVLWNHGGGWRAKRTRAGRIVKAICWDDSNGEDCLYMKEVKSAISSSGTKLNLIGFDACLMGMIEVATDVKDLADVMVGSEELEPGAGWPYDLIMPQLAANPSMDAKTLGSIIVTKYDESYKGVETEVTQSAIDLTKISNVHTAIKNFISAANQWSKIKLAREATRTFSEADGYPHADLYHFMKNISAKGITDPAVLSGASSVMTALSSAVIEYKYGSARTNSFGSAIFFPKTQTAYNNAEGSEYAASNFNAATGWDSFIKKYWNPPADKPVGTVSIDGTGTAKFSRTTPAKPNYKLSSLTFYYTATEDMSGGQVTLTIPSDWSPSPTTTVGGLGEVLLYNYSGVSTSMSLSGKTIKVDASTLPKGKKFKLTLKKFTTTSSIGTSLFVVKSKGK